MANSNGWGDGASNNNIGWGQGANNAIGWGDIHADSWAGATDVVGITTPPVDADAQAFITAASITDPTQQSAINQLVVDLKGYGVWTKMKALYPFVGVTSSTHKWNLKDPRDLDAAFRLVFSGGWTHSSTGALPNGTNAFANTYLAPNAQQSLTSGHFSLYSRTSSASSSTYGGSGLRDSPSAKSSQIVLRRGVDSLRAGVMWDEGTGGIANGGTETDARGMYLLSRTANNNLKLYKNSSTIATNTSTQTATSLSTYNYYLGGVNENGAVSGTFDNKELAFASIGDGLTDTESANFYTAVQTFQTTLGRQVGTPIPFTGLLDTYSGAAAAYSLRKLSSAYSGNCIRVRRSSDNTEQDFGFVNNVLDTASLLTFCGAGNGFVTTWYDQSGNGNNGTQSTAANQPQIVSSGAMITTNGNNSMSFDGSNDGFNLTSNITVNASNYQSFVGKRDASTRRMLGISALTGAGSYLWTLWSDNNYYLQAKATQYQVSSATDSTTNQLLLTGQNAAGTMSMHKNGATITSSAINATLVMTASSIGIYTSFYAHCNLQEIIFYNSDQSANRIGIESNINTFYTIY